MTRMVCRREQQQQEENVHSSVVWVPWQPPGGKEPGSPLLLPSSLPCIPLSPPPATIFSSHPTLLSVCLSVCLNTTLSHPHTHTHPHKPPSPLNFKTGKQKERERERK